MYTLLHTHTHTYIHTKHTRAHTTHNTHDTHDTEAFMSHGDEVTRIPREAVVLSGNDHTRVQAMSVTKNGVESWFVQYVLSPRIPF